MWSLESGYLVPSIVMIPEYKLTIESKFAHHQVCVLSSPTLPSKTKSESILMCLLETNIEEEISNTMGAFCLFSPFFLLFKIKLPLKFALNKLNKPTNSVPKVWFCQRAWGSHSSLMERSYLVDSQLWPFKIKDPIVWEQNNLNKVFHPENTNKIRWIKLKTFLIIKNLKEYGWFGINWERCPKFIGLI